jgi:hypothetical protein
MARQLLLSHAITDNESVEKHWEHRPSNSSFESLVARPVQTRLLRAPPNHHVHAKAEVGRLAAAVVLYEWLKLVFPNYRSLQIVFLV